MRLTRSHAGWLTLAATATAVLPAAAHAATNVSRPSADLYVSASAPARNFGAARELVVTRRPARQAFVRFQLDGAPPAGSQLVLRLFSRTSSTRGVELRHASDRPWKERAI